MRGLSKTFVIALVACLSSVAVEDVTGEPPAPVHELDLELRPPVGPIDYTYAHYQDAKYGQDEVDPDFHQRPPKDDTVIVEAVQPQPRSKPIKSPQPKAVFQGAPLRDHIVYEAASSNDRSPSHTVYYQTPGLTFHRVDNYYQQQLQKPAIIYGPPITTTTTKRPVPTYGPPPATTPSRDYGPPPAHPWAPPSNDHGLPSQELTPPKLPSNEYGPPPNTPKPHHPTRPKTTSRPKYTHPTTPYVEYGPPIHTTKGPKWRPTTTTEKAHSGYIYTTPAPGKPRPTYGPPRPTYGPPKYERLPSYRLDPKRLRLSTVLSALSKLVAPLEHKTEHASDYSPSIYFTTEDPKY